MRVVPRLSFLMAAVVAGLTACSYARFAILRGLFRTVTGAGGRET